MSSCRSQVASPSNLQQAGRLLHNISFMNSGINARQKDGWQYADIIVTRVSGNTKQIEAVKWDMKATNREGTAWLTPPTGASRPSDEQGSTAWTALSSSGTLSENINDKRNHVGYSGVVSSIPYYKLGNDYGKVYFNIQVKYEGDSNWYPSGNVVDFVRGDYTAPESGELTRPF